MCFEYEIQRKTHNQCTEHNKKKILVMHLELTHVCFDDHVFLIIGMVISATMIPTTLGVHC
jgi:hypothetical protein